MSDPRIKTLKIKTGVVKRLAKEISMYGKEADKQRQKIDKMKLDARDEHDVKKQVWGPSRKRKRATVLPETIRHCHHSPQGKVQDRLVNADDNPFLDLGDPNLQFKFDEDLLALIGLAYMKWGLHLRDHVYQNNVERIIVVDLDALEPPPNPIPMDSLVGRTKFQDTLARAGFVRWSRYEIEEPIREGAGIKFMRKMVSGFFFKSPLRQLRLLKACANPATAAKALDRLVQEAYSTRVGSARGGSPKKEVYAGGN